MKSQSPDRFARAGLASTAVAVMVLTASVTNAQVVFDDGQTHVINDAAYAFERIEVRNHTTLIILDGAVISAAIDPAYDNASGLPVLGYSAAAIQVFDHSALIVEGGVFGGDRLGTPGPNFMDNWYSGSIAAFDHATVTIENGTFGRWAFRSGATAIFDHATLTISGGTFTDPFDPSPSGLARQAGGGTIELYGFGKADISGGLHASSINPVDRSSLNISGGTFGKGNFPDGRYTFFRGAVRANGSAAVKISGGDFGAAGLLSGFVSVAGSSTLKVSGGTFNGTGVSAPFGTPGWLAGRVEVSEDGDAKIFGGHFNGTTIGVVGGGQLKVNGCAFNLPFGKVWDTAVTLQGILSNGDAIDVDLTREDSPDASVKLIEACDL